MTNDQSSATYAPLSRAWNELAQITEIAMDETAASDASLLAKLVTSTQMIDNELNGMWFMPRSETQYFDVPEEGDGLSLSLKMPLLETVSVTNGDGSTLTSDDYVLLPPEGPPYDTIRIRANSSRAWTASVSGDTVRAIQINGVWSGTMTRYIAGSWYNTRDTVQTLVSSAETDEIVVADPTGADAFRRTPRLSPGMLLKWIVGGETEYAELLEISTTTLYVVRGARGTTPLSSIPVNTQIHAWKCNENIAYACARQAAWMESRKGVFLVSKSDGLGGTTRMNTNLWDQMALGALADFKTAGKAAPFNILVV